MRKTRRAISVKSLTALLLTVILIFSLTACRKSNDPGIPNQPGTNTTPAAEAPSPGGMIYMGSVEPQSLNPLLNKSKTYEEISKLLFQGLVDYDQNLRVKPALAENWNFNSGTCTIRLKSNIRWSDGQDVTAEDVAFSLDTIRSSADSIYKANVEHIFSYRAMDTKTIQIVFDQPFTNAIDMLNFPIIPKHVYSKNANAIPIGTGPYKVSEYSRLKHMELIPNDTWASNTGGQTPNIAKIKVLFISDLDAFSTAFQAKELDILNTAEYDWEKYNELKDVETYKYVSLSYDFIGLNFANPIFQDSNVRKAIITGINRKNIIDKYLLGNAVLTDVPVSPVSWLNDEKGVLYNYDKTKAQSYLTKAGFEDKNKDKILEREQNGIKQTLRFTLLTNEENEFRKKAAEDIKKNLADIGIVVDIKYLPFNDVRTALDARQFDAVLTGYNLAPTQDLSFAFHSTQTGPGGKNFSGYSNTDMDALLLQAYTVLDDKERKTAYNRLQFRFREEVPCISLFFREAALVMRDKIKGDIKPDAVNAYRTINQWFVTKNKQ